MARHAQPREVAELKGATRQNPQRYTDVVPKNDKILGDPPQTMNKVAQAAWKELAGMALPGVLTASERPIMEIAANLLAEYRADTLEYPAAKINLMIGIFGRLGMSPADRNKLGFNKPDKDDDFHEY